jgi:hypothetical protein
MASMRRQSSAGAAEMDASASKYVGYWYANISPFYYYLDLSPAVCIHRADESKGPSPLLLQKFITLLNIGQKCFADKGEKAKLDYWNHHNIAKSLKGKVETYVKEYKHQVGILQDTPRAAAEHEQEVVGLFRTYDAGASFTNQDAAPVNMKLAFTEEHVRAYESMTSCLRKSQRVWPN